MKAMIFAAGLGTRLSPLTDNTPKALVKIGGTPLLEVLIKKFIRLDIKDIIINVHHFAPQIYSFLKNNNSFGINIQISDESDVLLDTGGGIKKASWFFEDNETFLVYNVDILSDIDLETMINQNNRLGVLATLAVRNRITSRYLLFDGNGILSGWENRKTGQKIISQDVSPLVPMAFSGIHIINPEIFNLLTESGKFSIINAYLRLSEENIIKAYDHSESLWLDVGTVEKLKEAEESYRHLFE